MREALLNFFSTDYWLWAILGGLVAISLLLEKVLHLWQKLLKRLGNLFNANVVEAVKQTNIQIVEIKEDITELKFESCKAQILDFSNAIMNGKKYSTEQFSHIQGIIDVYEKNYSEKHNGELRQSIAFIRDEHASLMRDKKTKEQKGRNKWNLTF